MTAVVKFAKKTLQRLFHRVGYDVTQRRRPSQRHVLPTGDLSFDIIIDVGANEGQFAREISEVYSTAQIFCFEPLEAPFQKLTEWAATQSGRIRCFQMALGEHEGEIDMHVNEGFTPSSSVLTVTDRSVELYPQTFVDKSVTVTMSTLDAVLGDIPLDASKNILLKLDVQGFEDRVLKGASNTLSMCNAAILEVLMDHLYEGQAQFVDIMNLLHRHGLHFAGTVEQFYGPDGRVVFADALFLKAGR